MKPLLSACLLLSLGWLHAATPGEIDAARGVIARFAGDTVAQSLTLSSIPDVEGRHVYEIDDNGRTLRGSSAVALCKAFYANVKAKGAGICSWTGNRFDDGAVFTPSQPVRVVAPFRHYQYFNVVTFGYSLPFWDEARWMREIDWMALHGFDMPLALIAYEAIAESVWKRLGLSDEEIDAYLVGPAHLPWMRMGNLSERPDGPLPKAWRERSVRLQHAVLQRMRALGMKPVMLGFAGFVPQGIARLHPEARLLKMRWSGFHSWFLSPDQPLFRTLGKMYVEEWEKEFGPCEYWLADSFNEMELPWETEEEKLEGLAHCGENVFGAIQDGHPGATWVMTETSGASMTFVASQRPPIPTSKTARRMPARRKRTKAQAVSASKKVGSTAALAQAASTSSSAAASSSSVASRPLRTKRSFTRTRCGEV